ncbi:MAG: outer membrane beta-barrel protein [Phycisphaerae bacterium]
MDKRSFGILLGVAAMLATSGLTWADSSSAGDAAAAAPTSAVNTENAPPLMYGLDQIQTGDTSVGQSMQNLGITIGGYGEVGYTKDFGNNSNPIPGRTFTSEAHNNLTLNAIDLFIAKNIDLYGAQLHQQGVELGGKVEVLYGYNGDFIHSNGMNYYHNWNDNVQTYPLDQFDLEQLYVDAGIALGDKSAMLIRFGKFNSPMGYERINPAENAFYSHSFAFGNLTPYTQTGILAKVVMGRELSFWGAVTRGWNQSFSDNNTGIDGLVGVGFCPNSHLKTKLNISVGPQDNNDNGQQRVVVEPTITYIPPILNNALSLTSDTVFYYDGAGNTTTWNTRNVQDNGAFDEALYQTYQYNRFLAFNFREEYAYFGTGVAPGLGNTGDPMTDADLQSLNSFGPTPLNLGELTVGLALTPFPDNHMLRTLVIRPELREDLADHSVFSGNKHYQTTFGVDAVYSF